VIHRTHNMNIRGAVALGDDYIYALTDGYHEKHVLPSGEVQKGKFHRPGLYCIDGEALITNQLSHFLMLRDTMGGVNSEIQVNASWDRFAYIRHYDIIELLPVPHTNLVEFIGIPAPNQILFVREERGTFSIFTIFGELMSWSLLTGKEVIDKKNSLQEVENYLCWKDERKLADFSQQADSPAQVFEDFSVQLLKHKDFVKKDETSANALDNVEIVSLSE